MSKSHARIAFENFLTILTAITILALVISCSDVNNARERESVFQNCVSATYGHVLIFHSTYIYGFCVGFVKEIISNRKKPDAR